MKTWTLAAALLAAAAVAHGQALPTKPAAKAQAKGGSAIASVNGVAVPAARLELLVKQQEQRGMPDNEHTRSMVREELINRELIVQEAQRTGLAKSADVQTQVDLARQEIVVGAYLRDWVSKNPITDADVKKEYERAKSQAGEKEYRARHILVETEDEAKKVIAELKKGGKFDEIAAKSSKDPGSAQRGGDLDWNVPGTFDKQFSDAMVNLEKGSYTDQPVRTRFGFHVIRLDDVRAVQFPPYEQMRGRLQQQLVHGKVEALVKSLRAKAKIQ